MAVIAKEVIIKAALKAGWVSVCPDCGHEGCKCGRAECICTTCDCAEKIRKGKIEKCVHRTLFCDCGWAVGIATEENPFTVCPVCQGELIVQAGPVCECVAWQQWTGDGVVMVAEFERGWVDSLMAAPIKAQVGGLDATYFEIYNRPENDGKKLVIWEVDRVVEFIPTPAKARRKLGLHRVGA